MKGLFIKTKKIAQLRERLSECFNFSIYDIRQELVSVFLKHHPLNKEEKIIFRNSGSDPILFALEVDDEVSIPIQKDYKLNELNELYTSYNLDNDTSLCLTIMTALFSKHEFINNDNYKEVSIIKDTEGKVIGEYYEGIDTYDDDMVIEYQRDVRPDLLRLYIAMNSKRKEPSIKIRTGNNKTITIENLNGWFDELVNPYLDKYLGVKSVEEAQKELNNIYGAKTGRKSDYYYTLFTYGTYLLLKDSPMSNGEGCSNKTAMFILDLICILELHKDKKGNPIDYNNKEINEKSAKYDDANIIRGKINHHINEKHTIKDALDVREYKFSPNSEPGFRLW